MKLQGLSRAKASARAVLAGRIANGIVQAQRRILLPCRVHVAYETEVTRPPVAWGRRRDHLCQPKLTSPQKSGKLYATHPISQPQPSWLLDGAASLVQSRKPWS